MNEYNAHPPASVPRPRLRRAGLCRVAALTCLLAGLSCFVGCTELDLFERGSHVSLPAEKYTGKLLITGSSTMAPMVAEIAKRFHTLHPDVQIEVQAGGSVRGLDDLRRGISEIGMVSRALREDEKDLFGFPIARDGVTLIVHKENPIDSLSKNEVVGIYSGRITNWREVGGPDKALVVMRRAEGRPSVELFRHYFGIKGSAINAHLVVGDNPEAIKAVADNPCAIVPVSVGEAQREAARGVPIKSLPVDGVAATRENVRTANFPISRSLCLVTKEPPTGLIRAFIDFSLSAQVTDIAKSFDFVPYLD